MTSQGMLGDFYPTAAKTAAELTTFDNHAERTIICESFCVVVASSATRTRAQACD